jgi:hypothetical protein
VMSADFRIARTRVATGCLVMNSRLVVAMQQKY